MLSKSPSQTLVVESMDEAVARLVAEAPPLTTWQRERFLVLLAAAESHAHPRTQRAGNARTPDSSQAPSSN